MKPIGFQAGALLFTTWRYVKATGYNPRIGLPRLRGSALHDLTSLQNRVDVYAQRALDYSVRKAVQKGWTLADNAKTGNLADRYFNLAVRRLGSALDKVGSPCEIAAQQARNPFGRIVNGRPFNSRVVDAAIMNRATGQVYSVYDITYSAQFNTAATNQAHLRYFNPQDGFIREFNPSVSRRWP